MIHFRDLKIKSKLTVTFFIVLVPLMVAGAMAIWSYADSLRESSELELTNLVNYLYRLCEIQSLQDHQDAVEPVRPSGKSIHAMDIRNLSKIIRAFKVGLTGYPYIMDSKGNLIIHPVKTGQNIYQSRDSEGFEFIKEICNIAVQLKPGEVGTIRYPWLNDESESSTPRMKVLKFKYFKDWDWIIAAGSYEEEIYQGLGRIKWYLITLVVLSAFLVVFLTIALNRIITNPLIKISEAAAKMAGGDLTQKVTLRRRGDEIAELAGSFNVMADQISENTENLEKMIDERTEELQESREKYRGLVEGTVDGIVTADLSGNITFANSGMEKMLGFSRKEILGKKIWHYYSEGKGKAREIMKELREKGNITNFEIDLIGHDATIIPIRASASLLLYKDGKERGSLGIFSDTTSEKKLQNELKKAQAQLVQSMKIRALGDLVSGVAHEISNPLMAATTMMHVISSETCKKECHNKSRMDLIPRCHDRIAKIVNHLREFSRQTDFKLNEMDMNTALDNALLITSQQLFNMHITIEKEIGENLPFIRGDSNRVEQVFLDIIANARDAMERIEGDKILKVNSHMSDIDGIPAVAVEISDTGPGIPQEVKDKIFDPFFTTKEVGKGTGLGLSICFSIIEEHRGVIEAHNNPDRGAAFVVKIPYENNVQQVVRNGVTV